MALYFKKKTGIIIKVGPQHDIKSLMDRFEECDINGNPIAKKTKKIKKDKKEN